MKVDGPHRSTQLEQSKSRSVGTKEKSNARPDRSEQVNVSQEARSLAEARAPEVPDQERIDRLKEAISNGTFKIDVDRIATQMLEEER